MLLGNKQVVTYSSALTGLMYLIEKHFIPLFSHTSSLSHLCNLQKDSHFVSKI